jgi:hypothetical protein
MAGSVRRVVRARPPGILLSPWRPRLLLRRGALLLRSVHAHLYERYTRILENADRETPFVAAGTGGYFHLAGSRPWHTDWAPTPGLVATDRSGNHVRLDSYLDTTFGFLRIDVSEAMLTCAFMAVDEGSGTTRVVDTAVVNLGTDEPQHVS